MVVILLGQRIRDDRCSEHPDKDKQIKIELLLWRCLDEGFYVVDINFSAWHLSDRHTHNLLVSIEYLVSDLHHELEGKVRLLYCHHGARNVIALHFCQFLNFFVRLFFQLTHLFDGILQRINKGGSPFCCALELLSRPVPVYAIYLHREPPTLLSPKTSGTSAWWY